jgi:phosphoribosyl-AMP cyclohydrolase
MTKETRSAIAFELELPAWLSALRWDKDGLLPVVAQERVSKDVLMVAWMNAQALQKTVETGCAVYFSRSRKKLWFKGEESGHVQRVHDIRLDCDADVLLLSVTQEGHEPTIACHTGRHSCFYQSLSGMDGQGELHWKCVDAVLKDPQTIYKK